MWYTRDMKENIDILAELLGSKTRARLLALLLSEPSRRLHLRELVRQSGVGSSSVQRELEHLERIGVIRSERAGSNRFFLAAGHRLQPQLRALVLEAARTPVERPEANAPADVLARLNPAVRPKVPALVEACRRHHASRVALFGSSTQPEPDVTPQDLDVLVTFGEIPAGGSADAYFELLEELERIMGMPVDVVMTGAVRNPYFRAELEATQVVVYEAA